VEPGDLMSFSTKGRRTLGKSIRGEGLEKAENVFIQIFRGSKNETNAREKPRLLKLRRDWSE